MIAFALPKLSFLAAYIVVVAIIVIFWLEGAAMITRNRRRRIGLVRETDELNNPSGCGPWLILFVGYIVALSAIGISLILITVELEASPSSSKKRGSTAELAVPRQPGPIAPQARKVTKSSVRAEHAVTTAAISQEAWK